MAILNVGDRFSDVKDILLKIRKYEVNSCTNFYRRDGRTINSARKRGIKREFKESLRFYAMTFACIHGGKKHESFSTGKRPNQRTFKKECPPSISFLLSADGQHLELKSINEEHNHEISKALFQHLPRERRIPEEMTEEAETLIFLKVNKKLMMDHLEQKTWRKVLLKDITNLQTTVKKKARCTDVATLVQKLKANQGSVVEVFASEDNTMQGLFYQDKERQDAFESYPEIFFVDATYKLNNLRMPLYVFLVEDSMGQSELAGLCFISSEEQHVVQHMAELFKKHNPSEDKMKIIMADKDFNERERHFVLFYHQLH